MENFQRVINVVENSGSCIKIYGKNVEFQERINRNKKQKNLEILQIKKKKWYPHEYNFFLEKPNGRFFYSFIFFFFLVVV